MVNIVLISWVVGWIASIHPIYNAIMSATTAKAMSNRSSGSYYSSDKRIVERSDVVGSAIFATIIGAAWFVCTPFYLSHFIYSKRKPNLAREIDIFEDDERHRREIKSRIANAHKALEAENKPRIPRTTLISGDLCDHDEDKWVE